MPADRCCAASEARRLEQRTLLMGADRARHGRRGGVGEVGKLWRRRVVAEEPETAPEVIQKGARAALDTVEVARRGYQQAPAGETALFNLLSAFVISSSIDAAHHLRRAARRAAAVQRAHRAAPHPPLRARASCSRSRPAARRCSRATPKVRETLAIPLGIGIGLTFDESALLLELEDVYWSREGLVGVQITLATASLMAAGMLALRILRRGERSMEERHELPPPVREQSVSWTS